MWGGLCGSESWHCVTQREQIGLFNFWTLYLFERANLNHWTKSKNSVIQIVICHYQNPFGRTEFSINSIGHYSSFYLESTDSSETYVSDNLRKIKTMSAIWKFNVHGNKYPITPLTVTMSNTAKKDTLFVYLFIIILKTKRFVDKKHAKKIRITRETKLVTN